MSRFTATPFHRLRDEMDRMLTRMLPEVDPRFARGPNFPALNAWEEADAVYVEAEVPGVTLDDLEITVKGDELTISGERKLSAVEQATYHRRERVAGKFERFLQLPYDVAADKVEAKLKDGVLTIVLPKSEAAKSRKVEVKQV